MSAQEHTGRIQGEGPDFREGDNRVRTALVDYPTKCLNVVLRSEPSARQNGSLAIEEEDTDGRSDVEVAERLTVLDSTRTVQNQLVPLQSVEHLSRSSQPNDGQKPTSSQISYGLGEEDKQETGRGGSPNRGLQTTAAVSSDPVLPGSTLSVPVASKRPSDQQTLSSCNKRSRISSDEEEDTTLSGGTMNQAPTALGSGSPSCPKDDCFATQGDNSSVNQSYGMDRGASVPPSGQNWSKAGSAQPEMKQSFEDKTDTSEVLSCPCSNSPVVERGPTEGLDVLTISGLPPNATKDALVDVVQSAIKSANPSLLCQVGAVTWGNGEARVHVSNVEAVFALWRIRHRPGSALSYEGHPLSWDVAIPEAYEENRILVDGLPADMTDYKLYLHIRCSSGCIRDDVVMTSVFLQDQSKAVIFFDDTIVDANLVEELNKNCSYYEGTGHADIFLSYRLIPVSRSVRLSGYDGTIDRGTLRNYFNRLQQAVKMDQPVLVEQINTAEDRSALVTFRRADDCRAVLSLPQLPGIGSKDCHPRVELYSEYPQSATIDVSSLANYSEEQKQPTVVDCPGRAKFA